MDSMGAKEMTDKLLIERELLEELRDAANEAHNEATRPYRMKFFAAMVEKADAILAATRQPEGDGLEVWGNKYRVNFMGQEFLCSDPKGKIVLETIPLCRLSDAQRAIAELREVNRIQLEIATVHDAACVGIRKQRDKLKAENELLERLLDEGPRRVTWAAQEELLKIVEQYEKHGVIVPVDLLTDLRDSANECYNVETTRRYTDERRITIYAEQVRQADELLAAYRAAMEGE